MQWHLKGRRNLLQTAPFSIEAVELEDKNHGHHVEYYRIASRNWVNILPITCDRQVILIQQSRAGSMSNTLEIPGGVIETTDPGPDVAAARELEEETGYRAEAFHFLGHVNPNPAIMTNDLYMFLATGVHIPEERRCFPDKNECISLVLVPIEEAIAMARSGRIGSALAALTMLVAEPRLSTI